MFVHFSWGMFDMALLAPSILNDSKLIFFAGCSIDKMVRNYKRKTNKSTIEKPMFLEAINRINNEKISVWQVANEANIPRTTLMDFVKKIDKN